jgi:hypothetical protein
MMWRLCYNKDLSDRLAIGCSVTIKSIDGGVSNVTKTVSGVGVGGEISSDVGCGGNCGGKKNGEGENERAGKGTSAAITNFGSKRIGGNDRAAIVGTKELDVGIGEQIESKDV